MTSIDTKLALLQALIEEESYGLEIIERVRTMTKGHVKLLQGRVYPALRELESEGLLESFDGPMVERAGRPRRYYRLTAEGRRAAREQARALAGLLKPALGVRNGNPEPPSDWRQGTRLYHSRRTRSGEVDRRCGAS